MALDSFLKRRTRSGSCIYSCRSTFTATTVPAGTGPLCPSMTALDVYKRQMGMMVNSALMNSGLPSMANRPMASLCRGDVYKRQALVVVETIAD